MEKYIDLHVHSNCSDGTFTPEELVTYALEKNLAAFALTDHDTTAGVARARNAASGTGLEVIPGIELSTEYQGKDIHILGLGIHLDNPGFQKELQHFQNARDLRNEKMIQKLQECNIRITLEQMLRLYPDCVWTRAHFARFLLDHGYVKDMRTAFDIYLGDHAPCFVPREKITPFQALDFIHQSKGVAVLAHPLLYRLSSQQLETLVSGLTQSGLDGLEALYSNNSFSDDSTMRQLAARHNLAVSGGSDFHGSNKPSIDLATGKGNLKLPYSLWLNLKHRQQSN